MKSIGDRVMAGKGSSPRPIPNRQQFDTNWDSIFKEKEKKKDVEDMGEDIERQQDSQLLGNTLGD